VLNFVKDAIIRKTDINEVKENIKAGSPDLYLQL
jgi:hypothetical protein